MQIILDLLDDFAARLNNVQDQIPQLLDFGLRALESFLDNGFAGLITVLEFLVSLPPPEEILDLRPSDTLQAEIEALLEKVAMQVSHLKKKNCEKAMNT